MEEFIYYNNLYDCYSSLLTDKQKIYFEEYYFNNLSLSEIAENYEVSRNAVYKQIQITIDKLKEYEEKLGLYKKKEYLQKELEQQKDNKIKKIIEKLLKLFILILVFSFSLNVNAKNIINDIDIDVNILENGNAIVTETWDVYTDSGTEIYRTYGNLLGYNITNFNVVDDKNNKYEVLNDWNVSATFNEKKYKSGTRYDSNQLELCWGISEYGNKKYVISYTIEKLVKQYSDCQGIYFSFLAKDMTPLPQNATIKIHSDYFKFDINNSNFKLAGYDGRVILKNNSIIYETDGPVLQNEYMTTIVQIKENAFSPNDSIDSKFNEYIADNKTDKQTVENKSNDSIKAIPVFIGLIAFIIGSWFLVIPHIINLIPHKKKTNFNKKNYELTEIDNYCRDIPCNGNLAEIYWIAYNYNLLDEEGCIFGSYLLKWLFKNKISIDKSHDGIYSIEDKKYSFNLNKIGNFDNQSEEKLKNIFLSAASSDFILEPFEFKEWSKEQYSQIISWLDDFLYEGQKSLIGKGFLNKEEIVTEYNFQKITREKVVKTKELDEIANKLSGLKRFMLDFSNFNDKSILEVSTWEDYLVVAEILGIADKVSEQFSRIYPDYKFIEKLNITTVVNMSNEFSKLSYTTAIEMNASVGGLMSSNDINKSNSSGISINTNTPGGSSSGGGIR